MSSRPRAQAFGIDAAVFLKCEEIRRKTDRFSSAEVQAVFRDYLKEVGRLCELIDQMEVRSEIEGRAPMETICYTINQSGGTA